MYRINYIMHCKRHLNTAVLDGYRFHFNVQYQLHYALQAAPNTAVEKQASKGSYTI